MLIPLYIRQTKWCLGWYGYGFLKPLCFYAFTVQRAKNKCIMERVYFTVCVFCLQNY